MNWQQALIETALVLLVLAPLTVLTVIAAVERGLNLRTQAIIDMFERALQHGGSLDTFVRSAKQDAADARTVADGALEAVKQLKEQVDDHERFITELEASPIGRRWLVRRPGRPPGSSGGG